MFKLEEDQLDFIAAANNRNFSLMKELLGEIGDINCRNNFGQTALIAATRPKLFTSTHQDSEVEIVRWLLDNNADLRAVENNGYSAIHHAVVNGNVEVVNELLERDLDLINFPLGSFLPIQLAVKYGHYEVLETLVLKGADVNIENPSLRDLAEEIYDPKKREEILTLIGSQQTAFGLTNANATAVVSQRRTQGNLL